MSKKLLIIVFLLSVTSAFSQSFDWLLSGGGPLSDKATGITIDSFGNTYITGYFNEEGYFGPFYMPLFDLKSKEVFVAKIDPQGNYVWVKRGSNHYDDRGLGICLDPMGNVYVTGTCWGGLIFGSLNAYNTTHYTDQIFVLKLDSNGNEIWLKNAGINETGFPYNDDQGWDIASDRNGDIYVTGFLSNCSGVDLNAVFDSISTIVAFSDSLGFVAKLSNAGTWQWVRTFEGLDGYRDNRIATDNENNVYVAGGFTETKTFGNVSVTSRGGSDVFVTKYDSQGNFIYVTTAGSPYDDRANDITFDGDRHMYITGEFKAHAVFGNDTVNNNGSDDDRDIFVTRMTKNGTFEWVKKAGSHSGGDRGNGIVVNSIGNIFVTGQYKDTARFGDSLVLMPPPNNIQVFVAGIDSLGKWRWVMDGGSVASDRGTGITCDNDCNVYVDGFYEYIFHFGTDSIDALGKKDMFTLKINEACFYYPSPELPDSGSALSVPNVFTPNGDGVNDEFKITCRNIASLRCSIFNRWGMQVSELNTADETWKGVSKSGAPCPPGVYYYVITAAGTDKKEWKEKGFVQLLK